MLAVVTVSIGLAAGPVYGLAERAAAGLFDRSAYIEAVLGSGNPGFPETESETSMK
jgi:multicomponent Na+:H+ antiporter subunit D